MAKLTLRRNSSITIRTGAKMNIKGRYEPLDPFDPIEVDDEDFYQATYCLGYVNPIVKFYEQKILLDVRHVGDIAFLANLKDDVGFLGAVSSTGQDIILTNLESSKSLLSNNKFELISSFASNFEQDYPTSRDFRFVFDGYPTTSSPYIPYIFPLEIYPDYNRDLNDFYCDCHSNSNTNNTLLIYEYKIYRDNILYDKDTISTYGSFVATLNLPLEVDTTHIYKLMIRVREKNGVYSRWCVYKYAIRNFKFLNLRQMYFLSTDPNPNDTVQTYQEKKIYISSAFCSTLYNTITATLKNGYNDKTIRTNLLISCYNKTSGYSTILSTKYNYIFNPGEYKSLSFYMSIPEPSNNNVLKVHVEIIDENGDIFYSYYDEKNITK